MYAKNYLCKGTQILRTVGGSEAEVRGGALCRDCEKGGGGVPQGKMEIDFSHCALSRGGHTEHPTHYPELVTKGSEITELLKAQPHTAGHFHLHSHTRTHTHAHPHATHALTAAVHTSRARVHTHTRAHMYTCPHARAHTHTYT